MDSIRTEVLDFYVSLGTKVIDASHDQDTTDLHKCIAFIRDFTPNLEKPNLILTMLLFIPAETEMKFGGLISTSNLVKAEKITVESDTDLLWTISIKKSL
ncbi:thiamine pyrophosphokinase 1 [Carica papaya]|uniref:thiamine pyrophosphokinase 1 n=1 Tax=Carica papaya TaxID=3649 RepID=UPI000B8C849A|nr:thiamine pyrophosphokinase 1 [Carica papaya]